MGHHPCAPTESLRCSTGRKCGAIRPSHSRPVAGPRLRRRSRLHEQTKSPLAEAAHVHYQAMRLAMNFTAREIAVAVEGRLIGDAERVFTEVAIDSRRVRPGCLFVALPGARTDGHEYIGAAL